MLDSSASRAEGAPAGRATTPDGLAACFPSADHIATALVTACRLTGEDPLGVARGEADRRGRHVALAALVETFPQARRAGLGRCCGYLTPTAATAGVAMARKRSWWNELWVDETVGALVAPLYGEDAS